MPLVTRNSTSPDHTRLRKPRNQPTSPSNPKPQTHSFIQSSTRKPTISSLFRSTFSNTNNGSNASKLSKKTKNKNSNKKFTLRGLGCASSSTPAVVRSSAEWEAKKVRKEKQRTKKKLQTMTMNGPNTPLVVVVDVPDVCCAPGIAFASDAALVDCVESKRPVAPRGRVYGERTNHRERSCTARRTTNLEHVSILDSPTSFDSTCSGSDISNARQYRHFRHRSPGGLSEIMMFQSSLIFGESLDGYDQFGDWRLDVDNLSYEELLDLGDRIGYVGTGLREEEITCCLGDIKHPILDSLPLLFPIDENWNCSICQEGYEADDEVGKLNCGHCYHIHCIKQWLLKKNACPVCKAAAAADN